LYANTSLSRFVQGRSAKVKSAQNSARMSNQGGLKQQQQQQQQQHSRYSAKSEVSLRNSSICRPEHSETKDDDEEQQQPAGRKQTDDSLMTQRLKDADSASRRAL
jgi:hypothetical protein